MGCDAVGIGTGEFRLGAKDFTAFRLTQKGPISLSFRHCNLIGGAAGASPDEKKKIEAELLELKKGNSYHNEFIALSANVREEQGIKKFIRDFRSKKGELEKGCK